MAKSNSYSQINKFNPNLLASEQPAVPSKVVQSKRKASCAQTNYYANQNWDQLIAKTLDINDITKSK